MTITTEQFTAIFGSNPDASAIVDALNAAFDKFEINTKDRICGFLSQAGHESGGFKAKVENLNYSQASLRKVFPKYFPDDATAFRYARQPAAIANRVYGSRMGNGNEASGDGFRFRGRSYMQLTGKNNYVACGNAIGVDLISNPDYLTTVEGAVAAACWFWSSNGLNTLADAKDVKGMTKRVNGGYIGLAERQAVYVKAQSVL